MENIENNIGHSEMYKKWKKDEITPHTVFVGVLGFALITIIVFSK